jgi:HEAT repeat protein
MIKMIKRKRGSRKKSRDDRPVPRPIRRRAGFLAPAALAALLAASGNASAASGADNNEDDTSLVTHAQLRRMAEHPDRERRINLAALLPEVMLWMTPIERTELVSSWAMSSSPHLRLAIARALRYMPPPRTPGTLTAVEHLAGDPDASVRVAIAEAAWLRRREDPDRMIAVLHRLAEDHNLFVREVARLALGDA